jgi:hypothetical protein
MVSAFVWESLYKFGVLHKGRGPIPSRSQPSICQLESRRLKHDDGLQCKWGVLAGGEGLDGTSTPAGLYSADGDNSWRFVVQVLDVLVDHQGA